MSEPGKEEAAVRVGTRESALALWQARHTQQLLAEVGVASEVVGMTTAGDRVQDMPLSAFSEKGVFTKELDVALMAGTIDCAVHCVKDLPTTLPVGLAIGCQLARGVKGDCLVMSGASHSISGLADAAGLTIGTSSLRRAAWIHRVTGGTVRVESIRGNLQTRLAKVAAGDYDGMVLARIGVDRMAWTESSSVSVVDIPDSVMPYAVGQGGLAVVIRQADGRMRALVATLNHVPSMMTCAAERAMLRHLEGGCKVPVAVRCQCVCVCLSFPLIPSFSYDPVRSV